MALAAAMMAIQTRVPPPAAAAHRQKTSGTTATRRSTRDTPTDGRHHHHHHHHDYRCSGNAKQRTATMSTSSSPSSTATTYRPALCRADRSIHTSRLRSKARRRSILKCTSSTSAQGYPLPSHGDSAPGDGFSRVRALFFYAWTILLSLPLFVFMCAIFPFQYLFDKHRRKLLQSVNTLWATLSLGPFVDVKIEGRENLPADEKAVLYVSNHQVARKTSYSISVLKQSYMDIFSLFFLQRVFKFVSKTSNFYLPIIGWSMFLTGHVPLKRMDMRSQMDMLKRCEVLLKHGSSVLIFPEGTRSSTGKMASFKQGAFSLAKRAQVPIVPISMIGPGYIMPNGKEYLLRNGKIVIKIHPAVEAKDSKETMKTVEKIVLSGLES